MRFRGRALAETVQIYVCVALQLISVAGHSVGHGVPKADDGGQEYRGQDQQENQEKHQHGSVTFGEQRKILLSGFESCSSLAGAVRRGQEPSTFNACGLVRPVLVP